jgi:hypothetical protein
MIVIFVFILLHVFFLSSVLRTSTPISIPLYPVVLSFTLSHCDTVGFDSGIIRRHLLAYISKR